MAVNNLKEKLAQVISKDPSKWMEEAKWRLENKGWLNRSQEIALNILTRLDELDMTQKELAEILKVTPQQVSKIVKGKENLTLESIDKLERALGIKLIEIIEVSEYREEVFFEQATPAYTEKIGLMADMPSAAPCYDVSPDAPAMIKIDYKEEMKYSYKLNVL